MQTNPETHDVLVLTFATEETAYGLAYSLNNTTTSLDHVLTLRKDGLWRKRTGLRVGVVHGIWNTNMNDVCERMGFPYDARHYKEISQPDIRMCARVARALLLWAGGVLLLVALLRACF